MATNNSVSRASVILLFFFICASTGAMAIDEELRQHPVLSVVEFYESNFAEVESLSSSALNQKGETQNRIESFIHMVEEYPEAAAIAARTLISDADSEIALNAIMFLMNELTMAGHAHVNRKQLAPRLQYIADVQNKSYNALRLSVLDGRPKIRNITAAFMASKSDQKALALISNATDDGLYTDREAANLYSLANGDVGLKFMERYLGDGGTAAQEIAVKYAGYFPSHQGIVRTKYFLNEKAPTALRVEASETLGKHDTQFAAYALIAANSNNVEPELYVSIVANYVDTLRTKKMLSSSSARMIDAQVNRFSSAQNSDLTESIKSELKSVSTTLKRVYEATENK